ncbi:hypothetical protein LCGC14_2455920, partial [marine sediment metagenome]
VSDRPRILDLFCGAGGAAMGLHRAGFEVVGVDIEPQPHYPFPFLLMDALEAMDRLLRGEGLTFSNGETLYLADFAAYWASPPCQRYSAATRVNRTQDQHPDLVAAVRGRLAPYVYVIENVVGAPLRDPVLLCGVERGLRLGQYVLRRHRLFESNYPLTAPGCGCHQGDGVTLGVYGGGPTEKARSLHGKNPGGGRPQKANRDQARLIMGMPWALRYEINQAIPPAYSEYIGKQLMKVLEHG